MTCSSIYQTARTQRMAERPFDRISAYKVRESADNIAYEGRVVGAITDYLSASPRQRDGTMLLGCTPGDMATRLRRVPTSLARHLGSDLVPAVEALAVEGVPAAALRAFLADWLPQVQAIISRCDRVQAQLRGPIKNTYADLTGGGQSLLWLCVRATDVTDQARKFCEAWKV